MLKLISKHTLQIFFVYLTLGAVIVLSINTYILIQNQSRILDNQEKKGLPLSIETNQKISKLEGIIHNLSEKIQ